MRFINKKNVFIGFLLIVLCVFFINIKNSYAEVDYSGKPTEDFNATASTGVSNYIKQAANQNTDVYNNFNVPNSLSGNSKPLYLLMKNLETPLSTETFELIDGENPTNISDKGILYILGHGYNTSNTSNNIFTSGAYGNVTDNNIKQYITQIALWLYIYEKKSTFSETYCVDTRCDFTNNSTAMSASDVRTLITSASNVSGYNYLKYITALVDAAKSYSGGGSSGMSAIDSNSLDFSVNDSYTRLTTDSIYPSAISNTANYMYYSLEIEDPNNYGVSIIDNNNNPITNLNNIAINTSFKVVVNLKSDLTTMNLKTIKIKIRGHFIVDDGFEYRVTDSSATELINADKTQKYSNVLLGYVPTEEVENEFTLRNFTKISKIDVTSGNELPGATLEIKQNNATVSTWVSTNVPHYFTLNPGSYQLCETAAPENYIRSTECIDFEVTENGISAVTMENARVPDTGFNKSSLPVIFGLLFLIIGSAFTTFVVLTKKNSVA